MIGLWALAGLFLFFPLTAATVYALFVGQEANRWFAAVTAGLWVASHIVGCVVQYLVLGYADPRKLFRWN